MSNTYTQIHIHTVFTVQQRTCIINPVWKEDLHRYITGIVNGNGHKLLSINSMPDHVHVFFGMRPSQSISNLMREIKGNSSQWINEQNFLKSRFSWQEGYGAFSYGKSQLDFVIDYIKNQEQHHQRRTFLEEYKALLDLFGIDYDERYLFKQVVY